MTFKDDFLTCHGNYSAISQQQVFNTSHTDDVMYTYMRSIYSRCSMLLCLLTACKHIITMELQAVPKGENIKCLNF